MPTSPPKRLFVRADDSSPYFGYSTLTQLIADTDPDDEDGYEVLQYELRKKARVRMDIYIVREEDIDD